jgi:hypothetical protein
MKTKTSAGISIILWSIILVVAIMLFSSLSTNNFTFFTGIINNPSDRRLLQQEVITDEITDIQINWISGGVKISQSDDFHNIYVHEYALGDLDRSKWATINVSNNQLIIESLNQTSWNLFFWQSPISYLEVFLPEQLFNSVVLKLTSGNYELDGLEVTNLDLNATSGSLVIKNVETANTRLNITSGNINASGLKADDMDIIMTSGNVTLNATVKEKFYAKITSGLLTANFKEVAPTALDVDMTAGRVEVELVESADFEAVVSKVSGSFNADFTHTRDGDRYIYRNGSNRYSFKITSGSIKLIVND